jgi:hypothetical protein
MVLREGEGEASTPRLQRAEAKRAAQNNLKRKLEKLAARRHCGTFLAPTKVQKRSIAESESEVEQGRDVAERAVFKTPPRSASVVAPDGEAARPQAEGPEGDVRRARESELRLEEANRLGADVCPSVAGALNARCMAGIANARLFSGPETDRGTPIDALAETNDDDGCSVASDTGAGEDLFDDRGDGHAASFGDDELLDESGSGRRTLRNLLVRHVNTGIASDAVSLVPPRFANGVGNLVGNATSSAAISAHDGAHKNASPTAVVAEHAGETFCARAAIRKTIAAKERRAFDSPPRTGYGKSALFRGRSGGNLKNLVASERRASASPSGSEGFAFIGAA